LEVANEGMW
jgi:hypothetical protein